MSCKHSFVDIKQHVKHSREFIWFKRWLIEGYNIHQLSQLSHHSPSKLRRIIHYWLDQPIPPSEVDFTPRHIVCDGTYIQQRKGIFLILDSGTHKVIHGEVNLSENYTDLKACFKTLNFSPSPISATVDGNPAIKNALRYAWPDIAIQRCLIHIQRQGLSWCRMVPKREDARVLRSLFLTVLRVNDHQDEQSFYSALQAWEGQYGEAIRRVPGRGRVFSDLKRARSMLINALPDMFRYLDNPDIVKSTNTVEGYFGRMKQRYRQHCGLASYRKDTYFRWYLHLVSK